MASPVPTIAFERVDLDDACWVDVARGFLATQGHDHDEVYAAVQAGVAWRQGRIFRYERWVDEPRLGGMVPHGSEDAGALTAMTDAPPIPHDETAVSGE